MVQTALVKNGLLDRLKSGAEVWNHWRAQNPKELIDLAGADLRSRVLSGYDLSEVSLRGANLSYADLSQSTLINCDLAEANLSFCNLRGASLIAANLFNANLSHANLLNANLLTAMMRKANLSSVDLRGHDLRGQDLRGATLRGANLSNLDLRGQDFSQANLKACKLRDTNLSRVILSGADLSDTDLSTCVLELTNFRRTKLINASLRGLDLTGYNFSEADMRDADLRSCTLGKAVLDGADISGAKLWNIHSRGWSIRNIKCERASWDEKGTEVTHYAAHQFEQLFADKATIEMRYEKRLTSNEIATLPFLIEHLEAVHWGCTLRLKAIDNTPGKTRVTLVVEDPGSHNPSQLEASLKEEANRLQSLPFSLQSEPRLKIELREALSAIKEKFWPRLLEISTQQSADHVRHLAILFMDLKGFSNWPEQIRHEKLSLFRELLKPVLKMWQASYPNMEGDSLRATFPNVSAAISCACMIQRVIGGAGFGVRVGLDLGEVRVAHNVVTDQPDLEGNAVNFAARLESLAETGQVLASETIRHHAEQDRTKFEFYPLELRLKKGVGDKKAGDAVLCYAVELRNDNFM